VLVKDQHPRRDWAEVVAPVGEEMSPSAQKMTLIVESNEELIRQCTEWDETRNGKMSLVDWQFTTKDARMKLKHLYPSL